MISHQQRTMIANLSVDELPRQRQAHRFVARQSKLLHAQKNVLQSVAARNPVEPAAHRKVGNRYLHFAERLNRLRRNLDIAKQSDVRKIPQTNFLNELVFIFDLQDFVSATHAQSLGVEVKRTGIIACRDQSAEWLGLG